MSARRLGLLIALAVLPTCGPKVMYLPNATLPHATGQPRAPEQVDRLVDRPRRPHVEAGLIVAHHERITTMLPTLVMQEAARRGCDAVWFLDKERRFEDDVIWLPMSGVASWGWDLITGMAGCRASCIVYKSPDPSLVKVPEAVEE